MNKEELNQIQYMLIEQYKANLAFLKENFEAVFEKVEELSLKIESGEYKEQYSLEMQHGYFDIKNLENDGFYYATNSYKDAEERKEYVDFTNNNSLNLLKINPYNNKLSGSDAYKDVLPIVEYINHNVDLDNVEYKKIYKYVYIGTGLGFHIQEIDAKVQSYTTLIIEPELEIFRLSLFTMDYSKFHEGNRNLFLSVGEDEDERRDVYSAFSTHHSYMNYSIKYYNLLVSNEFIKDELVEFFRINQAVLFSYKLVLNNIGKVVKLIKDKQKFINVAMSHEKKILANKKVLLISSGPSLDNYVEWIVENQSKFIIISIDTMVPKLEKYNIVPHIIFSIDPSPNIAHHLTTDDPSFLDNTAILFLTQQDEGVYKVVEDKNYYCLQVVPLVESLGYLGSLPNVGTYAFMASVHLGAQELYTIGNDACFHQETGQNYASDCRLEIKHTLEESADKNMISNSDVYTIKGNFRDEVKTNRDLGVFVDHYRSAIAYLEDLEYKAYNLSDGAYIEGLEPLEYDKMIERAKSFKDIKLDSIKAVDGISMVVESIEFDNDVKVINNIISRVKKFQGKKFKTQDDFLQNKLDLMIWTLEMLRDNAHHVFSDLFLHFTNLADIYLNFVLNLKQKDLHTKDTINDLSRLWSHAVIELFKDLKKIIK